MFLKEYKSLVGYLERFTVIHVGRLHIRLHRIKSADRTPFLHSHPFHYISFIMRGGYEEELENKIIDHKRFSFIFRRNSTYHRIKSVRPDTVTLFFTWKTPEYKWRFGKQTLDTVQWPMLQGVYKRQVFGKDYYAKFDKYWHIGHTCIEKCLAETSPSIDQTTPGVIVERI